MTDPGRAARARQIFGDAIEKTGGERERFVRQACGDDRALRTLVESLLAAHRDAGDFLGEPTIAAPSMNSAARVESSGDQIGPYTLEEPIGEGGFGVVFRAQQHRPLKRTVALKIIKAGMDTRAVIARFDAERAALALMDHPHIARVLDAGATATGRPYFVMELVSGVPITQFCDEHALTTRQRLEVFMAVCNAVQHAHQKGIIHRDIKPGNILVAMVDGKPVPKVIDFGIAKATAVPADQSFFTQSGQIIGTPAYMSPEQAGGDVADIDTRTDVYSLGVLLYELLSGSPPFDPRELRKAGLVEVVRIIREVEPPRPSTRVLSLGAAVTTVAARRSVAARRLQQAIRGDLDWIAMKCLEKDRGRRYDSVGALASDVRHFLHDEPVFAGPPSRVYRLRKFARRNKGLIASVGAVAAALVIGLIVALAALSRERKARQDADLSKSNESIQKQAALTSLQHATRSATRAEGINRFFQQMLRNPDPRVSKNENLTVRELVDQSIAMLDRGMAKDQPEIEASARLTLTRTYEGLGLYEQALAQARLALEIRERMLGPDHLDVAEALGVMATAHYQLGEHAKAEAACRRALAIHETKEPNGSIEMASCLGMLAMSIHGRGAYDEALTLHEGELAMYRGLLGKDDMQISRTLSNIALVQTARANYREAEKRCREAIAIQIKLRGDFDVSLAVSLNNLGFILDSQDRFAEALEPLQKAEVMIRKLYHRDHPQLGYVLHNIGHALAGLRKYDDALPYLKEAVEVLRRTLPENHPYLVACTREYEKCTTATRHARVNTSVTPAQLQAAAAALKLYTERPADAEPSVRAALGIPVTLPLPPEPIVLAALQGAADEASGTASSELLINCYTRLQEAPDEYAFLRRDALGRIIRHYQKDKSAADVSAWQAEWKRLGYDQ